ncbi:MAG: hypothetical protein ACTTJ0_04535 [Porphyromonas endodontalis]|uniref:hypothetical protein n=1 Tax=Porphyromonas endodontalis TaxID=28124 RepID=UPI003FA13E57
MIRSLRWGILSLSLLFISMLSQSLWAQQLYNSSITVQFPDGQVSYFDTLDEAFMALKAGCVVYIPSGSYILSDKEETKVKCQVAIYGAGCRPYGKDTDHTRVIGNIEFVGGASSSVVMGLRCEGDIIIGDKVKNLLIKNVDVGIISFSSKSNTGCLVTSSVIRNYLSGNENPVQVTNCLAGNIGAIKGGEIANCILKPSSSTTYSYSSSFPYSYESTSSIMRNNIGLDLDRSTPLFACQETCTMVGSSPQIPYPTGGVEALFEKYDPSDPFDLRKNNYRLKKGVSGTNAGTDGKDIGLYGGSGFDDTGRAPIPKIKIREIAPQTDDKDRLKVKIEVIAN